MWAVVLGKALFWDVSVGSDGMACASCHFHAGRRRAHQECAEPRPDGASRLRHYVRRCDEVSGDVFHAGAFAARVALTPPYFHNGAFRTWIRWSSATGAAATDGTPA
jgi:cytochrome c peroxidase